MNEQQLKNIVEGALLAAGRSLSLDDLQLLFEESARPDKGALKKSIDALRDDYAERGIEIKETSSGFRIQVKQQFSEWVSRLWEERPTRYSRALLETLALVAYRQPITRAEIEEVRGVSVSTSIIRTLQERDWIRVVGHRDVPGRPAMYGTTRVFLDYFGLKSLDELPTLAELRDIDSINVELDLKEHGDDSRPAGFEQTQNRGDEPAVLADDDDGGMSVEVALADEADDEELNDVMADDISVGFDEDEAADAPEEETEADDDTSQR
jgi:segregation and condensation protein B